LLAPDKLVRIAPLLHGCRRYVIQPFQQGTALPGALANEAAPTRRQLQEAAAQFQAAGIPVEIRQA